MGIVQSALQHSSGDQSAAVVAETVAKSSNGGGSGTLAVEETPPAPPPRVTFPDAVRKKQETMPPPLKLETEESADNMSPRNMWQVYALGAFLILRWGWARWRERKDRGQPPDDSSS